MMVKTHDFIEVNYTGKIKDNEAVFDTTDEKIAKDSGIYNPKMGYKSVIICVGERQLIKGLDDQIIGKEVSKKYSFEVEAKDAFGKKDAKLIKLVPTNIFKQQNINHFVGLEVQIDGQYGIIRSINGGRTLVDFNHPLASKDVSYDIEIIRKVDDAKEQLDSLLELTLNLGKAETELKEDEAVIKSKIPEPFQEVITKKILEVVPKIKKVSYK
ncbi:peptidylprolyl isomerase [Candidatus Woesearchaeota archaeon]|nr:MAG: peptidylprolyl isomerase [Candidatus Woesearchaeota archaeon]